MPTQTFFNLPEEKRQRIIEAAVDEFAANPLGSASIARIVGNAGIPRGSFYQYFADIKDLYKYILDFTGEQKVRYMYHFLGQLGELDFFQIIREFYTTGWRFAAENPKLAAIGNNFFREDKRLRQEIFGELREKSLNFFEELLIQSREKGEIDPEVDISAAAFIFFTLNLAIVDHVLENRTNKTGDGSLSYRDSLDHRCIREPSPSSRYKEPSPVLFSVSGNIFENGDDLFRLVDQMLYIMENGIKNKQNSAHKKEEQRDV